jgi:hypothetical protein
MLPARRLTTLDAARQEKDSLRVKKTVALTLLLAALPLVLLWPGAPARLGGQPIYRLLATWGVPAAAALLALLFSLGGPRGLLFAGAPRTMRRLLPWCLAALVADFSFLGAGHLLGWVTFTFGDQGYSGHPARTVLWALPLCLVVGVFGWEWALRRTLFVSWARYAGRPIALVISCAVGVALAAPAILPGLMVPDPAYAVAAFVVIACREISCALIFASGAGLPAAGIYRGLFAYLDAFVINDWYSVQFPAANYTTSEPMFYVLRAAAAVLSAALVAAGARLASRP